MERVKGVFALVLLFHAAGVHAQDQTSPLEIWEDTLRFGIDSEIPAVLEQLAEADETSVDDLVLERFLRSRSTSLRIAITEHFLATGSDILVPEAERMLLEDDRFPNDLVRVLIDYRVEIQSEPSEELIDRYGELVRSRARSGGTLAANAAIEALGASGTDHSIAILLALFDELTSTDLQGSVIRALGQAQATAAVAVLTSIVTDEFAPSSLRQYGAESLGRIGEEESVAVLTELLSDSDSLLRAYATYGLGFYSAELTASLLEETLLDSFWRVRVAGLQALEEQRYEEALPAIEYKARRDPERPVREAALRTLGAIGNTAALEVLAEVATSQRASVAERVIAINELGELRGDSVDTYAQILTSEWEIERSQVLDAVAREISNNADSAYEPLYERLLGHPNFIMQIYAVRGIGNAELRRFEEELQRRALPENPVALARAAQLALGNMGIPVNEPEDTEP